MKILIDSVMKLMNIEINIEGFNFTFLDMFILTSLVGIVGYVVYRVFDN